MHTVPGWNFTQCVTHGSFRAHWEETVYNMFTFTTLYITPLSIMIVCYVRIIWEISKQLKINKSKQVLMVQQHSGIPTAGYVLLVLSHLLLSF